MKVRGIRHSDLTPEARIDAAKRALADAIDELVDARLSKGAAAREWVDQTTSPLGSERHLRLVRDGVLKGVKSGRRRLVRRVDIDAYLEEHQVVAKADEAVEVDVDAMMKRISGGRR